jgi:hypothetical protein
MDILRRFKSQVRRRGRGKGVRMIGINPPYPP